MTEEEIAHSGPDDLRDEVRRLRAEASNRSKMWSKSEDQKMRAMEMANSARILIQSVQAIRHLVRHMPDALSTNVDPSVDHLLKEAISDLDRADEIANVLPF